MTWWQTLINLISLGTYEAIRQRSDRRERAQIAADRFVADAEAMRKRIKDARAKRDSDIPPNPY